MIMIAIAFFLSAGQVKDTFRELPSSSADALLLGILLSATSPMHVTFWFGWSTVLIDKGILIPAKNSYRFYITGIGIGSIAGYLLFIEGGIYLLGKVEGNMQLINWIIGGVLLATGLIQIIKIMRKNNPV